MPYMGKIPIKYLKCNNTHDIFANTSQNRFFFILKFIKIITNYNFSYLKKQHLRDLKVAEALPVYQH